MAESQWDHHTGDNNDRTEGREDRWGDERGDSAVDNLIHDDPSFFPSSDVAVGKDGSPGGSGNGVEAIPISGAATEQAAGEEDGEVPVYDDPTGSMFAGPVATSFPSSMTSMRIRSRSRGEFDSSRPSRSSLGLDRDDSMSVVSSQSRRSRKSHKDKGKQKRGTFANGDGSATSDAESDTGGGRRSDRRRRKGKGGRRSSSKVSDRSGGESEDDDDVGRKSRDDEGEGGGFFSGLSSVLRRGGGGAGSKKKGRRPGLRREESEISVASSRRSASLSRWSSRRSGVESEAESTRWRREDDESGRSDVGEEEGDEDDPYGPYGSGSSITTSSASGSGSPTNSDEASSIDSNDAKSRLSKRNRRESRARSNFFLTPFGGTGMVGGTDPFFGDSRVDVPDEAYDDDGVNDPLLGQDAERGGDGGDLELGVPVKVDVADSRQTIYIPDEDLTILFIGWGESAIKASLWYIGCFLSLGILWLLGRWIPDWYLRGRGRETSLEKAQRLVVRTSHGTLHVVKVEKLKFEKAMGLNVIFPPGSSKTPFGSREEMDRSLAKLESIEKVKNRLSSIANANSPSNGTDTNQPGIASINSFPNGSPPTGAPPTMTPLVNTKHFAGVNGGTGSAGFSTPDSMSLKGSMRSQKDKGEKVDEVSYVDFRYYRFLFHKESGKFRMVRDWKHPKWNSIRSLRKGVDEDARHQRQELFGKNVIDIESRSTLQLLTDEVLHPFYIFQVVSIILWSFDDYYYYATCIAIISTISIATTLIETRKNVERMREMSRFTCPVPVYTNGEWKMVDSLELVPGDLVDVSEASLHTFPADFLLLSGDAIVNESMLTGESVPVSKVPADDAAVRGMENVGGEVPPDMAKHFLFCGTKIVRIRKTGSAFAKGKDGEAVAMVARTGFNTTKGALVRSMLFPKPMGFKFYRDSFRFIGVLCFIAFIGFCVSAIKFVEYGIEWHTIIIRALDLVTIVVPPALPATMSIGTSFAIGRLRRLGIFCISPNRVNIGGKINMACFDKTGTLTEDGLDVLGVRSVDRSAKRFAELEEDIENVPIIGAADAKMPLLHALATCHGLKLVNGEVIGDPLDLRMFEFTRWTLEEGKEGTSKPKADVGKHKGGKGKSSGAPRETTKPNVLTKIPERAPTLVQTIVRPPGGVEFKLEDALKAGRKGAHFLELGVIRTFDFVSSLRRMSVLVKKLKSQTVEVYVKGAPEALVEICDKDTLPEDFDEVLADYTRHGYRVIAVAAKSIPGLTWIKAQRLKREQVESDLRFLGLIVFENKLKPGTTSAIHTLRNAHIGCRMITGDNIRTAVSVARECGMVGEYAHVYMPTFTQGSQSEPRSTIEWTDVEVDSHKLDPYSLKPIVPVDDDGMSFSSYSLDLRDYHLAVSGDVFRWMMDFGPLETVQRMLVKGVVFARMSPDEKNELVERLQALGYTVGFTGDGANDCGALKAADVGLSLSEAEASVAAPFTSRVADISCFLDVLKEGRAALVTSFSCFKFMALYSIIQFTTVTLLYLIASSIGDFQFLYIDLAIILPVAVTMGRTEPYHRINPKRPTANLVSKKVLTSMLGQVFICSGLQIFVYFHVRAQPWWVPPVIDPEELDTVSYENTTLFLFSQFQYILVAWIFSVGPPYRQPIHSNRWLVLVLLTLTAFSTYVLFATSGPIYDILGLVSLPRDFHLELLLLVILNAVLCFSFEEWGSAKVAKWIGQTLRKIRKWRGRDRERRSHDKIYKLVQDDMDD